MVVLAALLATFLLLGGSGVSIPSSFTMVVAVIAAGVLLLTFLASLFPYVFPTFDVLRDPGTQAVLFITLLVGIITFFVFREEKPKKTTFGEWFEKQPRSKKTS